MSGGDIPAGVPESISSKISPKRNGEQQPTCGNAGCLRMTFRRDLVPDVLIKVEKVQAQTTSGSVLEFSLANVEVWVDGR